MFSGLERCGKSCRLRWMNYLRPDVKRGNFNQQEEELIIKLHEKLGNRYQLINTIMAKSYLNCCKKAVQAMNYLWTQTTHRKENKLTYFIETFQITLRYDYNPTRKCYQPTMIFFLLFHFATMACPSHRLPLLNSKCSSLFV